MLNTKEIKEQVNELIKENNKDVTIHVNNIVGIDQNNELVYLESISLYRYTGKMGLQVEGMTFEKVTVEEVEERREESWAYEERDMWVEEVKDGSTDDGLLEWWENCCEEAKSEGLLYPFDDDSYRSLIENKYDSLTDEQQEMIKKEWGIKGNPEEDIDEEVNQNSDWLTVRIGSMGNVLNTTRYCLYSSYEHCADQLKDWRVCLYPELIEFLMNMTDQLNEDKV